MSGYNTWPRGTRKVLAERTGITYQYLHKVMTGRAQASLPVAYCLCMHAETMGLDLTFEELVDMDYVNTGAQGATREEK